MKKMMFMLGGVLIAGGVIFAIQSYATSSPPSLPTSQEINALKSTAPENNNMLTAEMWDNMLVLLGKINSSVSDSNIWGTKWSEFKGEKLLKEVFLTGFSEQSSPKLVLQVESSHNRVPTKEGEFLWEAGFPEEAPNKLSRVALDVSGRIRSKDPIFPSDVVTKRYLEGAIRHELSQKINTMKDISRAGNNTNQHLWPGDSLVNADLVIGFFGNGKTSRNTKELKDYQGKRYTFCALGGVRYNEVSSDNDSCSCNVYKDREKGWILSAGAHRGGNCAIICTANCF